MPKAPGTIDNEQHRSRAELDESAASLALSHTSVHEAPAMRLPATSDGDTSPYALKAAVVVSWLLRRRSRSTGRRTQCRRRRGPCIGRAGYRHGTRALLRIDQGGGADADARTFPRGAMAS